MVDSDNGFFIQSGELAASAPDDPSPFFGDLTNRKSPGTLYVVNTIPMAKRNEIELELTGGKVTAGRGDVKIDRQGNKATVTFWGESKEGVRIDGVIQCPEIRSY